jgi:hypothetical protein
MSKTAIATLEYDDKRYTINDTWEPGDDGEYSDDAMMYCWNEMGNYDCDCNRSMFIHRQVDKKFKKMGCGSRIKLVGLRIVDADGSARTLVGLES